MRFRHNPWASARPSNWSSMSKADRRAWNRANWRGGSGNEARSSTTVRRTPRAPTTASNTFPSGWVTIGGYPWSFQKSHSKPGYWMESAESAGFSAGPFTSYAKAEAFALKTAARWNRGGMTDYEVED